MIRIPSILRVPLAALACSSSAFAASAKIDFARDIQPLLAQKCYDCHGAEKAKGGLHLTSRQHALRGGESGAPALVAGESAKSELIKRVVTDDENDVMPQKGDRLTPAEIAKLKQWIDEGADWPENLKHWAYQKPSRPAVPSSAAIGNRRSEIVNAIDAFVLARLPAHLTPSPALDKPRWLRRVTLDLIGLPPTPDELESFLADTSDRAHERVVDRLLASPRYGERWARPWLDLARYADSHGFQRDDFRDIWPYRDWVIRALNADMPFDQFTIHQLAGDLLPETQNRELKTQNLAPLIATGFHRTVATNVEAGTDQEEGRVNQVFDRVNTTAAVWLGSTLECAQCHNHKYDPFSQRDYYQLFAYFNHTPVETDFVSPKAKAALKFTGPYLTLPDPEKEAERVSLQRRAKDLDERISAEQKHAATRRAAWEETARAALDSGGQIHVLEVAEFESKGESNYRILTDKSVLLVDDAPDRDTYVVTVRTALTGITGFKLEALTDPSLPGTGPGRGEAERPNFVLNSLQITAASGNGAPQPLKPIRAQASHSQGRLSVENLLKPNSDPRSGWAINPQFGRPHWAMFELAEPVGHRDGTTFTFTLVQNFGGGRTIGRLRLSALTGRAGAEPVPADIATILRVSPPERSAEQRNRLENYFLSQDKPMVALRAEREKLNQQMSALRGPQTLVMRELREPRATHVLNRGNFLEPGERVESGTPSVLHPAPSAAGGNRLDLARWLVSPDNPLVARVTVNRWWAEFFGRGIVTTLEDFGVKGEPPTHPELLDWLAVEFMARGWSMKHIHKLITLSATYRQSSRITPAHLEHDPENKWLARGPRFRLDAETIRDNALAVAGLLSAKMYGPPVRPYQPPGLWENKVGGDRVTYEVSTGEDAHRRGLYTVWKRASPYPSFMNFDATARTACTIKRSRTNTPLQALTLLNDPVYVEAALALAKRVLTERPDGSTDDRLRHAFQLGLTRPPTSDELAALRTLLDAQLVAFRSDAPAAKAALGKTAPPANTPPAELAAWHAVATALLNLDEMITKP